MVFLRGWVNTPMQTMNFVLGVAEKKDELKLEFIDDRI